MLKEQIWVDFRFKDSHCGLPSKAVLPIVTDSHRVYNRPQSRIEKMSSLRPGHKTEHVGETRD